MLIIQQKSLVKKGQQQTKNRGQFKQNTLLKDIVPLIRYK